MLAAQIHAALPAGKAAGAALRKDSGMDPDVIGRILRAVSFDDWAALVEDVEALYVATYLDGGAAGARQLAAAGADVTWPAITAQVHAEAVAWAQARAAELVGMRRLANGMLVPNPSAAWAITESTREMLRADVVQALAQGWSADELASALTAGYAFSAERATTIARTELGRADVQGSLSSYRATGEVAGKRLLLGSEHVADGIVDECDAVAALGVVPLDSDFDGHGDPIYHPNCVCDVVPVLAAED